MRLKPAVSLALSLAVTAAASAHAATVTSMTIEDVGSGLPGTYSSTLDGYSGAFRFAPIDDTTYYGAAYFTSDVGPIDTGTANPAGSFSTGFSYAGAMFVPFTPGPIVADITGGVLTIDSLSFGGTYNGADDFYLPPDPGTLVVHWLHQVDATHYAYKIGWSHLIVSDGPNPQWAADFVTYWRLEGIATVSSVPVPTPVWLLGSGLIALAGLAGRKRARSWWLGRQAVRRKGPRSV